MTNRYDYLTVRADKPLQQSNPSDEEEFLVLYKKRRNAFLIGVIGFILFQAAMYWAIRQPLVPDLTTVEMGEITATSPTELCPGDALSYTFVLSVLEPTVVDVDSTVLRVSPPNTLLSDSTRRAIFPYRMQVPVEQQFVIPNTYVDQITGEESKWEAGDYLRLVSVTAKSRITELMIGYVPFTIKDC